MGVIYETVKNVVIYLIFITVVMNLLGSSSYKKYIGIFSGMILIIIVVSPLVKLFGMDESLEYYLDIQRFSIDTKEINMELSVASEEQKEIVMKEYKETLKQQMEKLLLKMNLCLLDFEVTIEKNQEEKEFGIVKQMWIKVGLGTEEEQLKKERIETIKIEEITIGNKREEHNSSQQGQESAVASLVKREVEKLYELEQNQIIVEVQGR